jgi:hypothetical protein
MTTQTSLTTTSPLENSKDGIALTHENVRNHVMRTDTSTAFDILESIMRQCPSSLQHIVSEEVLELQINEGTTPAIAR